MNWFSKKQKEKHPVYTIRDKQREEREVLMSVDLKPLAELWKETNQKQFEFIHKSIREYRDFLGIMKNFIGSDNPLVTKFEVLLNRLEHTNTEYNNMVKDSLDKAVIKGKVELKTKV